jgi:phytoene dehydrogenase-like protein
LKTKPFQILRGVAKNSGKSCWQAQILAQYRTPIEGLYLCGAGAHPGGGVTGAPGHNAAKQVLRDYRGRGRRHESKN